MPELEDMVIIDLFLNDFGKVVASICVFTEHEHHSTSHSDSHLVTPAQVQQLSQFVGNCVSRNVGHLRPNQMSMGWVWTVNIRQEKEAILKALGSIPPWG